MALGGLIFILNGDVIKVEIVPSLTGCCVLMKHRDVLGIRFLLKWLLGLGVSFLSGMMMLLKLKLFPSRRGCC